MADEPETTAEQPPAFRGPYDHKHVGPYFEAPLPEPQQEVMIPLEPEPTIIDAEPEEEPE